MKRRARRRTGGVSASGRTPARRRAPSKSRAAIKASVAARRRSIDDGSSSSAWARARERSAGVSRERAFAALVSALAFGLRNAGASLLSGVSLRASSSIPTAMSAAALDTRRGVSARGRSTSKAAASIASMRPSSLHRSTMSLVARRARAIARPDARLRTESERPIVFLAARVSSNDAVSRPSKPSARGRREAA